MADAVFRVAADVADFISKMAYAEKSTKKVARGAASIGDEVGKSIVKIELLNRALNAAGRAISGVLDKAKTASETGGERAKSLATSFAGLGVRDITGQSSRFLGQRGIASTQDRVQFAKALESANRERRTPLKENEAQDFLSAFAQGGELLYGEGGQGLLEGVRKGRSLESIRAEATKRRPGVFTALSDPSSPLFQGIRAQAAEDRSQLAVETLNATRGASLRVGAAETELANAIDPGSFQSILSNASPAAASVRNALNAKDAGTQQRTYEAIIDQTQLMRQELRKPNFATETR